MPTTKAFSTVQGLVSLFSQAHRGGKPASGAPLTQPGSRQRKVEPPLIMIIDDSADDRWMMARCFVRAGFRVIEEASAEAAARACIQQQPQVVVIDLLMPHTGGLTACQRLRELPGGKQLPIFVVSGLSDPGTRRHALESGATEFVPKPAVGESLQGYGRLVERVCLLLRERGLVPVGEGVCATA